MPLVSNSAYNRPWYLPNPHLETIIPSLIFRIEGVNFERERLALVDSDFLDLDWLKSDNRRLIILSHGFGGSSQRHYIRRPAKYFHKRGWDILAWNNRGCSGEMNRSMKFHHHGDTDDLSEVINHCLSINQYDQIVLLGISMGGCQTVKYFGERETDDRVLGGFTVSVSCDLRDTTSASEEQLNGFYAKWFLKKMKTPIAQKQASFPELAEINLNEIRSFNDFIRAITVPIYGFESVEDFYTQSSCINHFGGINKPVFILNATNDPLLKVGCYPYGKVKSHPFVHLETPKYGGHVGFSIVGKKYSYIEKRAEMFINEILFRED